MICRTLHLKEDFAHDRVAARLASRAHGTTAAAARDTANATDATNAANGADREAHPAGIRRSEEGGGAASGGGLRRGGGCRDGRRATDAVCDAHSDSRARGPRTIGA